MRCFHANESICGTQTGADPGFLIGGGANPHTRGHQHTNLPDFPKKLYEIKKILVRRGRGRRPLGSATAKLILYF